MHIDIRTPNTKLSRAHSLEMAQRLRTIFAKLAHRIVRIVVRWWKCICPMDKLQLSVNVSASWERY